MNTNHIIAKWSVMVFLGLLSSCFCTETRFCSGYDKAEKSSIYGDALTDPENCRARDGEAYPSDKLKRLRPQLMKLYQGSSRDSRSMKNYVQRPEMTRNQLMNYHVLASQGRIEEISRSIREKRQAEDNSTEAGTTEPGTGNGTETVSAAPTSSAQTCVPDNELTPARLCKSTFNTTAPMYGVSLTSGEPVTIVQIFPDLLQQVVFEMCDAKECDVLHGECVQTYVPYLFLVIPLGPVTLTGQDYVLVESGCTCRPKFSRPGSDPNPASIIPSF